MSNAEEIEWVLEQVEQRLAKLIDEIESADTVTHVMTSYNRQQAGRTDHGGQQADTRASRAGYVFCCDLSWLID